MATEYQTEAQVLAALRNRFPQPEWAFFTGVSNGTGSHARRWADAIAMNLWPSRGLEIVGFEVKVSRSDMLRELKNPNKAEEIAKHCDRWFIAAGSKSIVKPEELPASWGLLVPTGSARGPTLKIAKDAMRPMRPQGKKVPKLAPLPRTFCAAILRRAAEQFDESRLRTEIRREIHDEVREHAVDLAESRLRTDIESLQHRLAKSEKRCAELSESLRKITEHPGMTQQIGQAIDLLAHLRGWQGAQSAATGIIRGIDVDKERLTKIGASMQLVVDLCAAIGVGET